VTLLGLAQARVTAILFSRVTGIGAGRYTMKMHVEDTAAAIVAELAQLAVPSPSVGLLSTLEGLIQQELQEHDVCLPSADVTELLARGDEMIGFHRALHWVLAVLRAAVPPPEKGPESTR
jgi:hypothetical protein